MAYGSLPQVAAEEDAHQPDPPQPILPQAAATVLPKADARKPLQAPDAVVGAQDRP
jgi:hypothetical protein